MIRVCERHWLGLRINIKIVFFCLVLHAERIINWNWCDIVHAVADNIDKLHICYEPVWMCPSERTSVSGGCWCVRDMGILVARASSRNKMASMEWEMSTSTRRRRTREEQCISLPKETYSHRNQCSAIASFTHKILYQLRESLRPKFYELYPNRCAEKLINSILDIVCVCACCRSALVASISCNQISWLLLALMPFFPSTQNQITHFSLAHTVEPLKLHFCLCTSGDLCVFF